MMVTVRVPAPPPGLLSNLVGLAGLATVCVMVAFLADWRWGGLLAGVLAVVLAVLAQLHGAQAEASAVEVPDNVRPVRRAA